MDWLGSFGGIYEILIQTSLFFLGGFYGYNIKFEMIK